MCKEDETTGSVSQTERPYVGPLVNRVTLGDGRRVFRERENRSGQFYDE